jgi:hypothetical protein
MLFLPSLLIVGCGGGGEFNVGGGEGNLGGGGGDSSAGGDGGSSDGESVNTSTISYLPLSVLEKYQSYSGDGFSGDNLFQPDGQYPLIPIHIINPIDSSSLASIGSAIASDYRVTIDDVEIDPSESFPVLQKIIGMPVQLKTAIVFDTSNSMDLTTVQYDALKSEAKAYIDKIKLHPNPIIKNQKFVVWSFDEEATDLTGGFSNDANTIKTIIDSIGKNVGSSSNLHKAIVKVVGRYKDTTATPEINFDTDGPNQDPDDFFDNTNFSDNDDDLVDEVKNYGAFLTQIVIFSSGSDSKLEFGLEKMEQAIKSQGFLTYDPIDPTTSNSDTGSDNFTNKPVFYYVTGGSTEGSTYQSLSDLAERTVSLMAVGGAYTFSDSLIEFQLSAIDDRIDLNNQYIYRYAFLPRQGDHEAVFSSKASNSNYSLTVAYPAIYFTDFDLTGLGTPYNELASLVEITGPNGEFLSADQASLAEVATFKPATRWTSEVYSAASDYSWSLVGGTGTANADGSYTVATITGASATLTLTNTVRTETAQIIIVN